MITEVSVEQSNIEKELHTLSNNLENIINIKNKAIKANTKLKEIFGE